MNTIRRKVIFDLLSILLFFAECDYLSRDFAWRHANREANARRRTLAAGELEAKLKMKKYAANAGRRPSAIHRLDAGSI